MFWRRNDDETATTPEERTRELLSAYRDGELSASEQAEATALVERDPAARTDLDELKLLVGALGNLGAEVRAPRSFAIAAPVAAAIPGAPLASFHRVEMFFRASAATAALLFAVVLIGSPPGETPVATQPSATMSEMTSMSAETPAAEALGPTDAAGTAGGATLAPAFAPEPDTTTAPAGGVGGGLPESTEESGNEGPGRGEGDDGEAGTPKGTLTEPAPLAAPASVIAPDEARNAASGLASSAADSASDSAADSAASAGLTAEPVSGTFLEPASSDDAGGMAAGLGTIAGLLTALSVLLAWNRRTATAHSSSDR